MGEIFERILPRVPLEWTGERLTTAITGQIEFEHLHRYLLARDLCRGLDVLDVAAGEGYGSALLAQSARSVIGIELSQEAALHAASTYEASNLKYLQGDARALPLGDASVDVVVSFETIEHFYEQDLFVAEVKRVLRPDGRFILSSPERDVYSPSESPANPYHVRELSRGELEVLLRPVFPHIHGWAQRPMIGSALVSDAADGQIPTLTFERRGPNHFESSSGLPRPPYFIVVASEQPVSGLPNSIFIETSEVGAILNKAAADAAAVEHCREQLVLARDVQQRTSSKVTGMEAELAEARNQLASTREELTQVPTMRDALHSAKSKLSESQAKLAGSQAELAESYAALARLREELAQTRDINAYASANAAKAAHLQAELARQADELSRMSSERDALLARQADELSRISSERDALRAALRRKFTSLASPIGSKVESADAELLMQLEALVKRSWKLKLARMTSRSFRSFLRRLRNRT